MSHHEQLLRIIREVRRRWRWKVLLRSATVLVGSAIIAVLAAAYGLEQFRFSPGAIIAFRVVTYLVLVALGWFFFVRPLGRRVTDQQVALYLEEHEPSLQELLVSAVDAGAEVKPAEESGESAALLRQVVKSAVERCQEANAGQGLERRSLRRSLVSLGVIGGVAAIVFGFGPAYLRHGALAVLVPVTGAEAASPYSIDVKPGSVTIARGADVSIAAHLHGFTATGVDLFTRASKNAPFERVPMVAPPDDGPFESTIFKVKESFDYFVEAAGVRSTVFHVEAAALPFVERLEMEFVYPAYTGLAPRVVDQGGDIAVLRGTTVKLRVHSSMATGAGRIMRDGKDALPLTPNADGTLAGSFEVKDNGMYRLDLATSAGQMVSASPEYAIDVLTDEPPVVSFAKPSRDLRATSVDEIFVEASASDDYGVKQLDLVYSVNGGPEKQQRLIGGGSSRPEVSAGHTFFLEELGLQPGDVVSYYARATDNDVVSGAKSVTSDMFFVQVQPFRKDYRAAESQAGGMQGGGQQQNNDPSALSEQQRRIVSGTFNTVRDRAKIGDDKFRQDVVFLALTQGQLRQRAEELSVQIKARVAQADPAMVTIAGALEEAAKSMRSAEQRLQVRDPKGALPAEQQALAQLQRAEEAYRDVRVRLDQQGGGGGGGGQQSGASEELANLFQLEMDKLRNQYETVQRGQQQSANTKVDEMLERLKELARRQEQEAERQRQLAGGSQSGGSQSGGSAASARQRQLAAETEEAARQLERLSREDNRQDLARMAQDLRSAADAMRRAAASGDSSGFAEARAAAERLTRARDSLEQQRTDRVGRDIDAALSRARRLANEQKAIEAGVQALDKAGANRSQQVQQLHQRKEAEAAEVGDLEKSLDRAASDIRRERPEAARRLQEAANGIRDDRIKEKINYSRGLMQGAPAQTAADFERQISDDIASLESRLRQAAGAAGAQSQPTRAGAMARARELARGVGSMEQRLRDQQANGQRNAQGQQRGAQGQQQGQQQEQQGQQGQQGGQQGQQQAQGQQGQGGGQQGGQQQSGGPQQGNRQQGLAGGGGGRVGDMARLNGDGPPRGEDPGAFEPRQFQREARERRSEAQGLRRDLQALGVDVRELDAVIGALSALDRPGVYGDPAEIERLQKRLADTLQRFQFGLRRELAEAGSDQLLLNGSDAAPEAYRKQIEEYYRSLARGRK